MKFRAKAINDLCFRNIFKLTYETAQQNSHDFSVPLPNTFKTNPNHN